MNIYNLNTNSHFVELSIPEALTLIAELSKSIQHTMQYPGAANCTVGCTYETDTGKFSAGKVTFAVNSSKE